MKLVLKRWKQQIQKKNEKGAALIYLLFLISFVAIVLSVMLTTVTQGQRNVLNNKEHLEHFYRAEGALEAAVDELQSKDANDREEFLTNIDENMDRYFKSYMVGGQEMPVFITVNVEKLDSSTVESDEEMLLRLTEGLTEQPNARIIDGQEEQDDEAQKIFKVRLFDPKDSWTKRNIYRELFFYPDEPQVPTDPDPDPGEPTDPPPFSCPNIEEYLDPRGNRVILLPPPPQRSPDGQTYPSNVAYVFEDCEYKRVFHQGAHGLPATDHILANPVIKTDGILVIPKEMGELHFANEELEFYAKGGMYVGASISTSSHKSIKLETGRGSLVLGEGTELLSSNHVYLATKKTGHLFVSDAQLRTTSNGEIKLQSGGKLTAERNTIVSSNLIKLTSADDLSLQRSHLEANSNGKIQIESEHKLAADYAVLQSSNSIEIKSKGDLSVRHGSLVSRSNGVIKLESEGHIRLDGAGTSSTERTKLESSSKIEILSGKALYASFVEFIAQANDGYFLEAENEIILNHSLLTSKNSGPIQMKSGSFIEAKKAEMMTTSWNDLVLEAQGNMRLEEAKLDAARDLLLTSSSAFNTIYVDRAEFRSRSDTAIARPVGINIDGTPKTGKISNQ